MSSFPEQLQEYALSEITRRIQTGEYPVGSRLVAKTIADSLNISATPVVAAINRLAAQGLVETIPRKGAVVKTFSTTDIGNYFEARTMIKCFVAHLAVQNVDKFPESVKKKQEAADQKAESLARITEHGSEDKGVSDRHKPGRVHFVVSRKTVHLDIHFKWFKKFRVSKLGRRFFLRRCLLVFHETEDLVIILDVLLECEGIFFGHPAAEDVECVRLTLCAGCKFTHIKV